MKKNNFLNWFNVKWLFDPSIFIFTIYLTLFKVLSILRGILIYVIYETQVQLLSCSISNHEYEILWMLTQARKLLFFLNWYLQLQSFDPIPTILKVIVQVLQTIYILYRETKRKISVKTVTMLPTNSKYTNAYESTNKNNVQYI